MLKLVNAVEPNATLNYNKHYIGLKVGGSPMNFVTSMPRRAHVIMTIKLPQSTDVDTQLEEAGIETLTYEAQWRQYRLRLDSTVDEKQREVLLNLVRQAREGFGKQA